MDFSAQIFDQVVGTYPKLGQLPEGALSRDDAAMPWGDQPFLLAQEPKVREFEAELKSRLEAAAPLLPIDYQEKFVTPLLRNLSSALRYNPDFRVTALNVEALAGAVLQHLRPGENWQPARQFLAVVSNFYRSFLSPARCSAIGVPQVRWSLPPLVTFNFGSQGGGPFTLTAGVARMICGAEVGVVSLPASFRNRPTCWVALADTRSPATASCGPTRTCSPT